MMTKDQETDLGSLIMLSENDGMNVIQEKIKSTSYSEDLRKILKGLLARDPQKRCTIKQIKDTFTTNISSKIEKFNVIMLGSGGVGKSSLTGRFINGNFHGEYDPTIFDSYTKQVQIKDKNYSFTIVDTAGMESFHDFLEPYLKLADALMIVYSITDSNSFEECEYIYNDILSKKKVKSFPMVLVGNKCDLEDSRNVPKDKAHELASKLKCTLVETVKIMKMYSMHFMNL